MQAIPSILSMVLAICCVTDAIEASSMILDDLRRNSYAVEQLIMEI